MDDSRAATAFSALFATHPEHADTIRGCMWMGDTDGVDEFKHRNSRMGFTFDQANGRITGQLDTGETSTDGDAVLRNLNEI